MTCVYQIKTVLQSHQRDDIMEKAKAFSLKSPRNAMVLLKHHIPIHVHSIDEPCRLHSQYVSIVGNGLRITLT